MLYIYTVCYNTPQYIEWQFKLLQKFIKNDFEYLIFNNTMTNSIIKQSNIDNNNILKNVCHKYNIKVIDIKKDLFNEISDYDASKRAGTAINTAHNYLFANYPLDSTFFLIDSDAFLLNEFDVDKFMENKKLSGRIQYRKGISKNVKYITNHIVIFKPNLFELNNFKKHFSFLPYVIDNVMCDCGGNINFIFDKMSKDDFINWDNKLFSKKGTLKQIFGGSPDKNDEYNNNYLHSLQTNIKNFIIDDTISLKKQNPFCEIFGNKENNVIFLHLRAGTNWIGYDFTKREIMLKELFNELLK